MAAGPVPPVVLPPVPEPIPTPAPTSLPASSGDVDPNRRWVLPASQALAVIGAGTATFLLLGWLGWRYWRRQEDEADDAPPPVRQSHMMFDLEAVDTPPAMPVRPAAPAPFPVPAKPDEAPAPSFLRPPAPVPAPAAPPPAPTISVTPAALDVELRPKRAGTNLLSAAVEYVIVIRNSGGAPARGVRLAVRLLSAGVEQDAWIRHWFAEPIADPAAPPFDLPPGGIAELDGMAMMPKEALSVMKVQDRALFVPVLAINLLYGREEGAGGDGAAQTATSHVVGIDRGEGAKMAPFRADGAPRMYENISQLPYIVSARR